MKTAQRGNILFLILLAVVLFAALSYAVTSSMRGGGNNASTESVKTKAADILQFLDQVENAVLRMRMSGNVKIENISFAYNYKQQDGSLYTKYVNSNCTDDTCRVFMPAGGGVSSRSFETYSVTAPTGWQTNYTMPGYFDMLMIQFPGAGTDLNDIGLMITGIDPAVCTEINNMLSVPQNIVLGGSGLSAGSPATWDNTGRIVTSGNGNQLIGKSTVGVFYGTGAPGAYCNVWRAVIAR